MGWIEDLEIERHRAAAASQRRLDMLVWSQAKTPSMANRLIRQIQKDAEEAARTLGTKVTVHLDASKLQIVHEPFPTFFLQVNVPPRGTMIADPMINCAVSTRKGLSFTRADKTIEVGVRCVGQDECYFTIENNNHASEEQVSQALLQPLFADLAV